MYYDVILIDCNNLYYRNYCVFSDLKTRVRHNKEIIIGGIHGFLISLSSIKQKLLKPNGKIYLLFDNFSSKINLRKQIDENYKENREEREDSFYLGINYLQLILLNYSSDMFLFYKHSYEADDLVKPIILSLDKMDKVLLVSNDFDWSRMLSYNDRRIDWYNKNVIVDSYTFRQMYGFMPSENSITLYKVFRGDKVDNIPVGLPNIRKELLMKLIEEEDNTIYDILDNIDNITYLNDNWKRKIKENKKRLLLNWELVSFINIERDDINEYMYPCHYKYSFLKIIYRALKLNINKVDKNTYQKMMKEEINKRTKGLF